MALVGGERAMNAKLWGLWTLTNAHERAIMRVMNAREYAVMRVANTRERAIVRVIERARS